MRISLLAALAMLATGASAQTIEILSVEEKGNTVEIAIRTDIATPFEVMAGVALAGQKPQDVFIGNSLRQTISSQEQVLRVPVLQNGEVLPSGDFLAEVSFYPRWGAEKAPAATKALTENIEVAQPFVLGGSGASSDDVARRENLQRWVMLNTAAGDRFNLKAFQAQLGESEETEGANANGTISAHYFPAADMTLFENKVLGTLVTWKMGREDKL